MNQFRTHLFEARKRARLTQKELAKKIDVHDTYISKMERGTESPPSRRVAVKLADALGMSNKPVILYVSLEDRDSFERFTLFLEGYVAGAEDVQEIRLVKVEDEEENESSLSRHSILLPAISVRSSPSNTTGGKADRLIASGRFSEEEEEEVEAAIIELINRFISFKEAQRKMQGGD